MAEAGFRKPTNGVLLDPKNNALTQYLEVITATNVKPGRLVMKSTTDDGVVVSTGFSVALGFAGYEMTPAAFKPATRDTVYVAGDRIAVHSGQGYMIRGVLGTSQTIVKGDKLGSTDSSGCLTKSLPGTTAVDSSGCLAVAMESVTTTTQVGAIWVEVV